MLAPNGMAFGPTLQRGYIKQSAGNSAGSSAQTTSSSGFVTDPRTVQFLYNPSSISVNHSISTGDVSLDPSKRSTLDPGQVVGSTGATLSFSLLFDRTYEVSNPDNFGTRLGEQGVAVDVNAIYALTGILQLQSVNPVPLTPTLNAQQNRSLTQDKAEAIAKQVVQEDKATYYYGIDPNLITQATLATLQSSGGPYQKVGSDITKKLLAAGLNVTDLPVDANAAKNGSGSGTGTSPQNPPGWPFVSGYAANTQAFGYMTVQPVIVVFGTQRQSWNPCLQYYGYINSLNIEFAHWTQNMVPSRAAVSIEVNLFPSTVDQLTQAALY